MNIHLDRHSFSERMEKLFLCLTSPHYVEKGVCIIGGMKVAVK